MGQNFPKLVILLLAFLIPRTGAFGQSDPADVDEGPDTFYTMLDHRYSLSTLVLAMEAGLLSVVPMAAISLWILGAFRIYAVPADHWSIRARKAFPARFYLGTLCLLIPILGSGGLYLLVERDIGIPLSFAAFLLFVVLSLVLSIVAQMISNRLILPRKVSGFRNIRNLLCTHLISQSMRWILLALFCFALGTEPGWWTIVALLFTVALIFWLSTKGALQMMRLLGLATQEPELQKVAGLLADKAGVPQPAVFRVHSSTANAGALIGANSIIVTDRMFELLTNSEMESVLAHELSHLNEEKTTHLMRYVGPFMPIPLAMTPAWLPWVKSIPWDNNLMSAISLFIWALVFGLSAWKRSRDPNPKKKRFWLGPLGGFLFYGLIVAIFWYLKVPATQIFLSVVGLLSIVGFFMTLKVQAMEKRADESGAHLIDGATYANALAKLYQENMAPAVMQGNNNAHPHLYDRLLAAGVTPDFPRPEPPKTRLAALMMWLTIVLGSFVFALLLGFLPQ